MERVSQMKLLLVDHERKLAAALARQLRKNGFDVHIAADGETGFTMACAEDYDLLILERALPRKDGICLLKDFRALGHDTPAIFLSSLDSTSQRVEGLDAGADDYLSKPFCFEELMARLRALARRKNKLLVRDTIKAAGLTLNTLSHQITLGTENIQLTATEASLLELLMCNYGQVVTKKYIMEKVWGYHAKSAVKNVDLYIHYLRKKLKAFEIRTIRGVGYTLEEESLPLSQEAL